MGHAPVPPAAPPTSLEPSRVAIEVFGTKQVTVAELVQHFGQELRDLCKPRPTVDAGILMTKLKALGDFADVELSPVSYYEPGGMRCYLTIDFVDRADAPRRMPFTEAPSGAHRDPEGLLAEWRAYEEKVLALDATNQISARRVNCPAFHCLGDPSHPALRRLAEKFAERVPAHIEELGTILRDDRDEGHREAAAYLLAYGNDGAALVDRMVAATRDPSSFVRNSALRVLADIAFYHPEIAVPLEPVLVALDYPTTLDRNKAAAILDGLLERPDGAQFRVPVTQRAGPILLAMLRLRQPNNHNFAYRILKQVSGQNFSDLDYDAWQAWLESAS